MHKNIGKKEEIKLRNDISNMLFITLFIFIFLIKKLLYLIKLLYISTFINE
jgi:hypothetical protein